jgi:anti-sigma factor RsiW
VVICLVSRRRLGSYLDGALNDAAPRAIEQHLRNCGRCRKEADALRRLQALLHQAVVTPPEPDWAAFWPGIVRRLQDGRRPPIVAARRRWTSPRWAFSGTAVAAAALSLVLWFGSWPFGFEEPVVVTSADTQYPGGTMVYHTPDQMAVVWVFAD